MQLSYFRLFRFVRRRGEKKLSCRAKIHHECLEKKQMCLPLILLH